MRLVVLIVPDKFKGTLTADAAAAAMARGWQQARPQDTLELLPMSDGGDGFGDVLSRLLPARIRSTVTVDAAHRPCEAIWWDAAESQTVVVESARVVGLAMLPPKQFHPFELDTFGLGKVLQSAAACQGTRCLVGIGGSATNDGGFGLARALGWRFLAPDGQAIDQWTELTRLQHLDRPISPVLQAEIVVATDVQNPLLGPEGASRIYGPQKGLRAEDFPRAEACLHRLAEVARQELGSTAALEPGSGAAGGLGFGLRCFLGAQLESGFGLFAKYSRLEERIARSNLVITGEGEIDASTLMGKGVGQVAAACQKHDVPCLGLAGSVRMGGNEMAPFTTIKGIAPALAPSEDAKAKADFWLAQLARDAAQEWGC